MAMWRPVDLRWNQDELRCALGEEPASRGAVVIWAAVAVLTAGTIAGLAALGTTGLIVGLFAGPGLLIASGFAVTRALPPGVMGATELILAPTSLTLYGPAIPGTLQVPVGHVTVAELRVAPHAVLRLEVHGRVVEIPVDAFDPAEIEQLAERIRRTAAQHRAFLRDQALAGREHARGLAAVVRGAQDRDGT